MEGAGPRALWSGASFFACCPRWLASKQRGPEAQRQPLRVNREPKEPVWKPVGGKGVRNSPPPPPTPHPLPKTNEFLAARRYRTVLRDRMWILPAKDLVFPDTPCCLGRGSFGEVLEASFRGADVAVKLVLPPEQTRSGSAPCPHIVPRVHPWPLPCPQPPPPHSCNPNVYRNPHSPPSPSPIPPAVWTCLAPCEPLEAGILCLYLCLCCRPHARPQAVPPLDLPGLCEPIC